ncbi:PilZ domain-containing protein [Clostridium sp. LBM24168]
MEDAYSYLFNRDQKIREDIRADERFKYNTRFKVISINNKSCNYQVLGVDISISGIGFLSEVGFEKGDSIEIVFKCKNVNITAVLKVVHANLSDKGFFVGAKFIVLKDKYKEVLKKHLLEGARHFENY